MLVLPFVSSAHFIVGNVNDALDSTLANDLKIVLWNPANGIGDNLTDIIGPNGNSGANNIYMVDCELLGSPCVLGDEIRAQIFNNGSDYITDYINLSVTGAGFDIMGNLSLNSPPQVRSIFAEDNFFVPIKEIDLTPASTKEITCEGVIIEYDGNESLVNVTGEFFDETNSFYGDIDDNNFHYTNNTCDLNLGYGSSYEAYFNCSFEVAYYANSGNWNCTVKATDNMSISKTSSNDTNINTLLALELPDVIDYGSVATNFVSDEVIANVTNVGNIMMNLSLYGYGSTIGDGLAMNCSDGLVKNISIESQKYNLTSSNSGSLTLSEFEVNYTNLTSGSVIEKFDLNYRQNDLENEATNQTYWRIYVPAGILGNCSGNIVFGAVGG
jgi:hypothetical protein